MLTYNTQTLRTYRYHGNWNRGRSSWNWIREAGGQEETNSRIKKTRHVTYSKLARATSWSRNSKLHLSDWEQPKLLKLCKDVHLRWKYEKWKQTVTQSEVHGLSSGMFHLPITSWCNCGPKTLIAFYLFISCFKIISTKINIAINIYIIFI